MQAFFAVCVGRIRRADVAQYPYFGAVFSRSQISIAFMAKNKPTPSRKPVAQPSKPSASSSESGGDLPPFRLTHPMWGGIAIAVWAFLLYVNTLGHGWALDDAIVITDNMFTTRGVEGLGGIFSKDTFFGFFKVEGKETLVSGGRYRPLTVALFAVVYEMFGDKPGAFHFLTILLYALLCFVVYRVVRLLLAERFGGDSGAWLALIAAGLFAAHPTHTEVVANVKGCDEIVTLLFSMLTLGLSLKAWDSGQFRYMWYAAGVFFSGQPVQGKRRDLSGGDPAGLALVSQARYGAQGGDMWALWRLCWALFCCFL